MNDVIEAKKCSATLGVVGRGVRGVRRGEGALQRGSGGGALDSTCTNTAHIRQSRHTNGNYMTYTRQSKHIYDSHMAHIRQSRHTQDSHMSPTRHSRHDYGTHKTAKARFWPRPWQHQQGPSLAAFGDPTAVECRDENNQIIFGKWTERWRAVLYFIKYAFRLKLSGNEVYYTARS